jgi:hypothetical protein
MRERNNRAVDDAIALLEGTAPEMDPTNGKGIPAPLLS